jgi:hypothetical protein
MAGQIAAKGTPARSRPAAGAGRADPCLGQPVQEAVWNTERCEQVIDAFLAFAHAIITLRRLIRCAWTLYRWDARPPRRP